MKESTAFVQGNVHGREEEERVRVKQPTSIVLTLLNVSSPSAKIRLLYTLQKNVLSKYFNYSPNVYLYIISSTDR